ncbi:MAG: TauD/TfdA family dioxygenase [Pseudomonadota bacterium]
MSQSVVDFVPSSPDPAIAARYSATIEQNGLSLVGPEGESRYFNAFWLRDNCPSSFDPETREREFDIIAAPDDLRPVAAEIETDVLLIDWPDGHRSRFPLSMLAGEDALRDPAELPRRLWRGDHYPNVARFAQPSLMAERAAVGAWAEALIRDGVAVVQDMPEVAADGGDALLELAGLIGAPRPTFFGLTFEVKVHLKPINTAYTAKALPMHTDVPAEEFSPGVQFLHCLANSVDGGDSLFADGAAIAEDLRREDPDAFEILATTPALFRFEHDGFDVRARQRAIELDVSGAVSGVTFSQHMWAVQDMPQRTLDRYYPAFRRFAAMMRDPKYVMRFRLNAGECIVFDNHRILHGRAAYSASSGSRHLRGTYVDRGEVRSVYRTTRIGRPGAAEG